MNELKRQVVRGLYKEAGIDSVIKGLKDAAIKAKDFAVAQYKKNPRLYNDAGGALAMMGLGKAKDAIQGKETTLLDYLTRGAFGIGAAEAAQWGIGKYKDLEGTYSALNKKYTDDMGAANTQIKKLTERNKALDQDLAIASTAAGTAGEELNAALEAVNKLNQTITANEAKHKTELNNLINTHKKTVDDMQAQHANEQRALKNKFYQRMAQDEQNSKTQKVEGVFGRTFLDKLLSLDAIKKLYLRDIPRGNTIVGQPSGERKVGNPFNVIPGVGLPIDGITQ